MGVELGVVIVAAILGATPIAPPRVAELEPMVMKVQVVQEGVTDDTELLAFLRERVAASWPPTKDSAGSNAGRKPGGRSLIVRVSQSNLDRFDLAIFEDDELLAQRSFSNGARSNGEGGPSDRVATRLAAWLFVRSTITRARGQHEPGESGEPEKASSSAPGRLSQAADTRAPGAANPDTSPGAGADTNAKPTGYASTLPNVATPLVQDSPPKSSGSTGAGVAVLVATRLAPGQAAAFGASLAIDAALATSGARVAGELGYSYTHDRGLTLHELPLTGFIGVRPKGLDPLTLGFGGSIAVKLAQTARRSRWALGVDVGPVAGWRIPMDGGGSLLWRAGWTWSLVRQRYVLDRGTRTDAPWSANVALGVEWP